MPNTITEGQHRGEFLVSEANGTRSRGTGTIISGQNLAAGAVVGKITASKKFTELDPDAVDGSEVAAGALYHAVDATGGDVAGAVLILRDAELNEDEVVWPSGISGGEKTTATGELASLGIILR